MSEDDNKANPPGPKGVELGDHYRQMLRTYGIPDRTKQAAKVKEPPRVEKVKKVEKPEKAVKALDPRVRHNWEYVQTRYRYPVNAIGVRIDPKDSETLRVWRENGIDKFLQDGSEK